MVSITILGFLKSLAIAMVAIAILLPNSASAMNMDQLALKEAAEEMQSNGARGPTRLISLPNNLMRFLFYSSRPLEHQTNGALLGYKRSSSALDALTGVTLGKRSVPSDYLNLEQFYGRQLGARSVPRMYDIRWTPFDSYDVAVGPETN